MKQSVSSYKLTGWDRSAQVPEIRRLGTQQLPDLVPVPPQTARYGRSLNRDSAI